MVERIVKTICSLALIMGLVNLVPAASAQSIAVSQEFDDSGGHARAQVKHTAPAQRTTIGKQALSAANARNDHVPPSSAAPNDRKTIQSEDSGWKDKLMSLLPSKHDLDKAFNAESRSAGTRTRTNWREEGR